MVKLKKYKLGELIDVRRGASLAGEFYATEGELVRLTLGHFDYQDGGFKDNTSKDNLYFTGPIKPEFILNKGDIITPLTEQTPGLLGSTAMIPESGKYIQSQDVALITPDETKLDRNFCYYLLPSKIVKQKLAAGAQQTKIRHTTPDRIKDLTVFIPDLSNQKAIGQLLRDIDRKIALNREINRNLSKQNFDIFGFGTYNRNRYQLYKFINEIAIELGKKTFIKTYHNQIKNIWLHVVNNLVRAIIGKQTLISISEYRSDLIAHQLLPSSDFRNLIQSADVVLDSKVLDQDGLTARFMWALGAEKKIITTNVAAKSYPFFSKDQILVLDENKSLHKQKDVVRDFLSSDFEMSDERRNMIKRFRIDNWINTLLLK